MTRTPLVKVLVFAAPVIAVCGAAYLPRPDETELDNRIPEAAPYDVAEARAVPPPYEEYWKGIANAGQCQSCHRRIFDDWAGSMMANAWRDPVWRGAFLLAARQTSTNGNCDVPAPPDGTPPAKLNPFASTRACTSTFDLGATRDTVSRPGSLVDGFCSRCHMPSNYVDNVPLHGVGVDGASGLEHAQLAPDFNPTTDAGTGLAFAESERQIRNTASGQAGVFCAICHSIAATHDTPYHAFARATPQRGSARGSDSSSTAVTGDILDAPDPAARNLGYSIGSGSFRLSPRTIGRSERIGPLTEAPSHGADRYLEGVFRRPMPYEPVDASKHAGHHDVLMTRSELCAGCHDVTNPLTVANTLGRWVGGFPIERTYTEWLGSRYADRPGNRNFDPAYKRDCQTCHMQQDFGQPGTAQSLYEAGVPREPLHGAVATDGSPRRYFSHHFVGGNTYVPRMVGASMDALGSTSPYPKLSVFSFTSADERSPYHNAYWIDGGNRGARVQQARLAWDRLRNVVDLELSAPQTSGHAERVPLAVRITNSGSGHKFPTGFPEGRTAWLAVHAFDLASGRELEIYDSVWKRTSRGVGDFTREPMLDPNVPGCKWTLPAGSPDPYAIQFKAVATLGDGCPTLDLAYAHARNLAVNRSGQPVDARGHAIDRTHPEGPPIFRDEDGDGDVYDDAFLSDTRLDPLPLKGAARLIDRYAVVVPAGIEGPIAVTTTVYYQSVEAVAAMKLLGNLADQDLDFRLEPCVLAGPCDGRVPSSEPAVVEGSPPVPMESRSVVVRLTAPDRQRDLAVSTYPLPDATGVSRDAVIKMSVSEPVVGIDRTTFSLRDAGGRRVAASVDQIGDATWGLFPDRVFLEPNATYVAEISGRICAFDGRCASVRHAWRFTTGAIDGTGGDSRVPIGFVRAPNSTTGSGGRSCCRWRLR